MEAAAASFWSKHICEQYHVARWTVVTGLQLHYPMRKCVLCSYEIYFERRHTSNFFRPPPLYIQLYPILIWNFKSASSISSTYKQVKSFMHAAAESDNQLKSLTSACGKICIAVAAHERSCTRHPPRSINKVSCTFKSYPILIKSKLFCPSPRPSRHPSRVLQTGGVRFASLKNRPENWGNRSVNRTARFALVF
jgi:hypothetical protein